MTGLGDAAQCCSEFGLFEQLISTDSAEVFAEVSAITKLRIVIANIVHKNFSGQETIFSQFRRRQDHVFPGQFAVALMCFPQTRDGAGNCYRLSADQGGIGNDFAMFVEIHIAMCGERSLFPVVQERCFAVHLHQHKAATADVAGIDIGCGERKPRRYRGVDRVAALSENLCGDIRGIGIGNSNRRPPGDDLRLGRRNRFVGWLRAGNEEQADPQEHRFFRVCVRHGRDTSQHRRCPARP